MADIESYEGAKRPERDGQVQHNPKGESTGYHKSIQTGETCKENKSFEPHG